MKKNMALFCIATSLFTVALSSCGNGQRDPVGGMKVLTYLISADSEAYTKILNKVVDDFNKTIKSQNYKIEMELPGGSYYTSLFNKMASRQAPDIFMMEAGFFNAFQNYLLPLDSYLDNSTSLHRSDLWDLNDFYKNSSGQICCLIKDFSPDFMLIYNKTMLKNYNESHPDKQFIVSETEPMTWAQYYEMTSTIQKEMGVQYGASLGFEGVKHLHELVQQTGSNMYINNDANVNINDSKVKEAFSIFCALQKDNATEFPQYYSLNKNNGKAPGSYTSGSTTTEDQLFKQGRCFSIFNGLYSFPAYGFYDITNFEYGVAPHPVMKAGDSAFGTTSAMVSHAISSTSKYKDIAWQFLEYYQTVGMEQFAKIAYNIPGNKTIAGSQAFLNNENEKVKANTNFFYNFVNDGHCAVTKYNNSIDYDKVQNAFNSQLAKYYDGGQSFENMLKEIDSSINNLVA